MDEDTARFVAAIRQEADEKGGSLGTVLHREADRIAAGHMSAFDEWAKGRFLEREQGGTRGVGKGLRQKAKTR